MLTLPVPKGVGILGSMKPLNQSTFGRFNPEVGFSPSVNSDMPYPIRMNASSFLT
ncbi:hypothetical protein PL8927_600260 [Planktothrix serta PCC 8927]|uniref:Uncharacterized protein n=1 Tax=Planktothrix serta PCC 8927 TaxID=671068 RepID=A0A7Z9BR82_9CYAN|nr:hypothetical protein PL8927_600260 [Planktothrix serta PCC 8927]